MASSSRASDENARVILTEDDIPGVSLAGRNPSSLKNEELKFWLRCRGDSLKELKTKAQLVKRHLSAFPRWKSLVNSRISRLVTKKTIFCLYPPKIATISTIFYEKF